MFRSSSNPNLSNGWGKSSGFSAGSTPVPAANTGSTSLFGNSASNNNTSSGGLFGNSGAFAAPAKPSFFGNSSSTSKPLFGGSTQAPSLSLNTSNNNNSSLNGFSLNSSAAASGGLFNQNSNTTAPSGALFGQNSNTTAPSGGLFGQKPNTASSGLFGQNSNTNATASSGGLFGQNSNNNTASSGGIFGQNSNANATGSGGLFGQNSNNNTSSSGGLFGQQNNTQVDNKPYVTNSIFQGVPTNYEMPASITGNLFSNENSATKSLTRPFIDISNESTDKKTPDSSSWFSRIATRFNIFGTNQSYADRKKQKGIFVPNDFPSSKPLTTSITKPKVGNNKITKPISFNLIENRSIHETKKLIIKSKPLKFHLIDADKVLNTKQKKVTVPVLLSINLLNDKSDDDNDSDFEVTNPTIDLSRLRKPTIANGINGKLPTSDTSARIQISEGSYWTSPSIDELSTWSLKDLSSIDNFIVGRRGYGQIAFDSAVDLSDIKRNCTETNILKDELFNGIIEIGLKYVKVYPDERTKPPQGFGINVPATITLEHIEPYAGKELRSFINILKNKEGMDFVTYDPIVFKWTFRVQHFSIWGLEDENGNDIDSSANDEYTKELKRQKVNHETRNVPGTWEKNASGYILNLKRNKLASEMNAQMDLLDENTPVPPPKFAANDDILVAEENEDSISVEDDLLGENVEYFKDLVRYLPTNTDLLELVQERAYEPEVEDESLFATIQPRPNIAVSDDWLVQLQLTNDINSVLAQASSDGNTNLDKKFDFQKVDALLFNEFNQTASSSKDVSTPLVNSNDIGLDDIYEEIEDKEATKKNSASMLPLLLSISRFERRENNFSKVLVEKLSFSQFKDTKDISEDLADILHVSEALFDKVEVDEMVDSSEITERLTLIKQKKVFGAWLSIYNQKTVSELIAKATDDFEKIYIHLVSGNIKKAVTTAISTKNNHLAAILTLADSNFDGLKQSADLQLQDWGNNDFIPKNLIKIYKFLSGEWESVLSGLPWNLVISSALTYDDVSTPLTDIIQKGLNKESSAIMDILQFYIYYSTGQKDKGLTHLKSSKIDVSIQWFFSKIIGEGVSDSVTLKFGQFLERVGLWKEAIYVYAHLQSDSSASKAIRQVVKSNIKEIKNLDTKIDEEPYLVNTLRVPHNLIYESVATEMNSAKDYWSACDAYITARSWEKAFDCIVQQLGPAAVVSKNQQDISKLQRIFNLFPVNGPTVSSWPYGVGIFQKYFELLPAIELGSLPSGKFDDVRTLLENLPLLKLEQTFVNKAALSILAKDIGEWALQLKNADLKNLILNLPLGENEAAYFNRRLTVL